ncbi:uncharacterized protein METZ01_LOCUS306154 [marine metagenome]|uniref:Type II secretion system protein GspC N-terminal domain-containing protein n=1 Tax=marine metagenome TaxID=408172 RepID=A0A382MXQ3_9ZZZZ
MNLAIHLPKLKKQALGWRAGAASLWIPSWVSGVLIIAVTYKLAELTWILLPEGSSPPQQTLAPVPPLPKVGPNAGTGNQIIEAHLFGIAPSESLEAVTETIIEAPETTLSLKLAGMVSVSGEENQYSSAIIVSGNGEQKTYQIGQTIDGSGGARLHSVLNNRVLVVRAGQLESLSLPKKESGNSLTVVPRVARVATTAPVREIISPDASRITDIIRVAPHIEQGQMVGFRVTPGKEQQQFTLLGLLAGDVVTDINGTSMNDPSRGIQVFESLGEGTIANVTVIREGETQVLAVDTSQLGNLLDNR